MMIGKGFESLSDADLLLSFGYKPNQIIVHEDGSATLNLDALRHDWKLSTLMKMPLIVRG